MLCYVWIDGSGKNLRSKSRTISFEPQNVDDIPIWNFDGSATEQASCENCDVCLKPIALFKDPFRKGPHKIVLCELDSSSHTPHPCNYRRTCDVFLSKFKVTAILIYVFYRN